MSLFTKIRDLLDQHGELTFREVCAAVNCWSKPEIRDCRGECYRMGRIGEAEIITNTILYPQPIGLRRHFTHQLEMFQ